MKHRKVLNRLSKSTDPEDKIKLKRALEQTASSTLPEEANIRATSETHTSMAPEAFATSTASTTVTTIKCPTPPKSLAGAISKSGAENGTKQRNLPPGYVIIPSKVLGGQSVSESFYCQPCQHSSKDIISVNAVSRCHIYSLLL